MKNIQMEKYDDIVLCNVQTDETLDFSQMGIGYIRVKTPALEVMQVLLREEGFFHADRMLKAIINLKRSNIDLDKKIRLEIRKTKDHREEILAIALNSFPVDRRFHVGEHCDDVVASKIITAWVDEIEEFYVCYFHERIVGFAGLEETEPGIYEIKLAAVDEKYRMSGAAVSLYAFLVKDCIDMGGKSLYGWISTVNVAVMNLYASLGAVFSEPSDIFLKEEKG